MKLVKVLVTMTCDDQVSSTRISKIIENQLDDFGEGELWDSEKQTNMVESITVELLDS